MRSTNEHNEWAHRAVRLMWLRCIAAVIAELRLLARGVK